MLQMKIQRYLAAHDVAAMNLHSAALGSEDDRSAVARRPATRHVIVISTQPHQVYSGRIVLQFQPDDPAKERKVKWCR